MARMVYISSSELDAPRAHVLGLGFILDVKAKVPYALVQGAGTTFEFAEPFVDADLEAAIRSVIDTEDAARVSVADAAQEKQYFTDQVTPRFAPSVDFLAIEKPTTDDLAAQVTSLTHLVSALLVTLGVLKSDDPTVVAVEDKAVVAEPAVKDVGRSSFTGP